MRLPIALLLIVGGLIGVTAYRKQQARKAEAARVAAVKDSIRVADSVALAQEALEEEMAQRRLADAQRSADMFAAHATKRREAIAAYRDTAQPKVIPTKQRVIQTRPAATNARPPRD